MPAVIDAIEAATNAAVGLLISWSATWLLLPLWGLHPSPVSAAGITAMFTGLSFARSYVLRRLFRRLGGLQRPKIPLDNQ